MPTVCSPPPDLADKIRWVVESKGVAGQPVFVLAFGGLGLYGGHDDFHLFLLRVMGHLSNEARKYLAVGANELARLTTLAGAKGLQVSLSDPPPPPPPAPPSGFLLSVFNSSVPGPGNSTPGAAIWAIPSLLLIPPATAGGVGVLLAVAEARRAILSDDAPCTLGLRRSITAGRSWEDVTFPHGGWDSKQKWAQPQLLFDRTTHTVLLMFGNITLAPGGSDGEEHEHGFLQLSSTDEGITFHGLLDVQSTLQPGCVSTVAPTSGVGLQLRNGPHAGRILFIGPHVRAQGPALE